LIKAVAAVGVVVTGWFRSTRLTYAESG